MLIIFLKSKILIMFHNNNNTYKFLFLICLLTWIFFRTPKKNEEKIKNYSFVFWYGIMNIHNTLHQNVAFTTTFTIFYAICDYTTT
jgi:hypothetical protein